MSASRSLDSVAFKAMRLALASAKLALACESLISASVASSSINTRPASVRAPSRTWSAATSVAIRALRVCVSGFCTEPNPLNTGDTVCSSMVCVETRQTAAGTSRTSAVGLDWVNKKKPPIPAPKIAKPTAIDVKGIRLMGSLLFMSCEITRGPPKRPEDY